MKRRRKFGRTLRWTCAFAAAVLFHLALFWAVLWTREPSQRLRRSSRQFTEIQYFDSKAMERSDLLNQQMTLFDPRPLLLPTEWNASNLRQSSDFTREESDLFADFAPMFEIEDGDYLDDFGNAPAIYEGLATVQVNFDYPLFDKIASKERRGLDPQPPVVEATLHDPGTGELLRRATIYNIAEALARRWPDWQPATFIVNVRNSFLEGGVSVSRSSGYAEADQLLQGAVDEVIAGGERLADGVYFIEMVP